MGKYTLGSSGTRQPEIIVMNSAQRVTEDEHPKDQHENDMSGHASTHDVISHKADDSEDKASAKTPKKAGKKVSLFQLYSYGQPGEYLMMAFGVLAALVQGSFLQIPYIFMSSTINDYTRAYNCIQEANATKAPYPKNCTDMVMDSASRVTVGFAVNALVLMATAYLHVVLFTLVADRITRRVRHLAFSNILRQNIGYFDVHFGGELNTRLTQDVTKYEIGIGSKLSVAISWLATFVTGLVICLVNGWQLTLIMCAFLPVAGVVSGVTARLIKVYSQREMAGYARAGAVAEEALTNIRIVAAFAGEKKEAERYGKLLTEVRKISIRSGLASAVGQGIPYLLTFSITAATIYFSGALLNDGKIEPGFVFLLFGCMLQGLRALGYATALLELVFDSQGAAYGLYEIIRAVSSIDGTDPDGDKPDNCEGLVTFEDVHFRYPARADVQILNGLTLTVKPGQSAALVGPSGCGKSTTIQLLQRFYDADQGVVTLDGCDIRKLNLAWLRRQIGVVSQDPVLFATTLEENIRFGRPEATLDEITTAAIEADAHHFIMKLPDNYKTLLNEQGTQLSRGEKQRISLARALVRKPKILLLDECTSALDNESEATVQKALDKAAKGRTTIIIAHRLSTVKDSDVLFVVDKGVVSESGTHDELLEKKGLYHKLVSTQMMEDRKTTNADEEEEIHEDMDVAPPGEKTVRTGSIVSGKSVRSVSSNADSCIHAKVNSPDGEDEENVNIKFGIFKDVVVLNRNEWPCLLIGLVGGLLLGATWPVFSVLLSDVIETIVKPTDDIMPKIISMSFAMFGLGAASCVVAFVSIFLLRYYGEILAEKVRGLSYSAMLQQEIGWFDKPQNQVGSLTSKLADEASRIKMATGNTLVFFAAAVSNVIFSIVISLLSGWQLGLAILPLMPLTVLAGIVQGYMNSTYEMKSHIRTEASGRAASEAIDKIRTIASLTKEDFFLEKYMSYFDVMKKEAFKRANVMALSWSFTWFSMLSILMVTFGFGLWLVSQSMMEFKMVFRILVVALIMSAEVGRANANIPEMTSARAAAAKLLRLVQRIPAISSADEGGHKPEKTEGEVSLTGVSFSFPIRPDVRVLRSFSLTARRGQSVAIVGPSGGGKSTVVQVVERFYDVSSGTVTMDGRPLKSLNVKWLRSQMAVVLQEPILFAVSIAENIAYGDNSRVVPREEVIEAAKQANIHSFITSLPQGYETNVGSKGTQLSGGQKQRISIARALIRNPKILLLDDATSALDSHSESVVEEALNKARAGRTSIIIAHRLSSIVNADEILYLHNGRVLEKGTHADLMAKQRHYHALYQANLGHRS